MKGNAAAINTLTTGKLWKGIVRYALPLMVSSVIQQLYNTVDTAVVGRFAGSEPLAAVGSTGSLINLLVGLFLGIASGTGVVFGTFFGAKDSRNMKRALDTATILAFFAGAILTVIGVFLAPEMLELINCPPEIKTMAAQYLRWFFAGMIPMLLYNVGAGIIYAAGNSRSPLIYLAISGFINFVLDFIFVAIFHWGAAGAAIATTISQFISATLIIAHLIKKFPSDYKLDPLKLIWDKHMAVHILKIAIPCGLQAIMFDISNLIVQAKINAFGTLAIAGMISYNKVEAFTFIVIHAFSMTGTTLMSQNIGAGNLERAKKGIRICLIMALLCALLLCSLFILFAEPLLSVFTDSSEVLEYGLVIVSIIPAFTWTYAISETLGSAIRGSGKPIPVTAITALSVCLFRVLWLCIMCPLTGDIRTVYWCYPISWTLCNIAMIIYYFKGNWAKSHFNFKQG